MFRGAQSKCQNADRCGFVGAVQENAGIANVQVGHVMGLPKTIRHKFLRIVSHAASARFMQAPARNLRSSPEPSRTPPAARSTSAHTSLECSHIFRTFSS